MLIAPAGRLKSLDIFRGVTIAAMILVNNPGSHADSYGPLLHAKWDGWTFTDTIFPFFLWIVGVALTLSTAKRVERGEGRGQLLTHTVRRAAILFGLGLFLSLSPDFHWAGIRIPGVLQRIAVCYLIAFVIFRWTTWRGQIYWILGLNAVYLALMMLYPVPGCGAGSWTMDCNFARLIDGMLLDGHMWSATKVWDPEGVISTIPSISTVLFGILAGHVLRLAAAPLRKVGWFIGGGIGLVLAGEIMALWIPFNKALWTTPFVLLMAGLASISFGVWYWVADIRGWGGWLKPLEVFGLNAIAAYMIAGLVADVNGMTGWGKWLHTNVCLSVASPANASLLYALANVAVAYAAVYLMYRRGWFLKL